jgi:hypothetical protein
MESSKLADTRNRNICILRKYFIGPTILYFCFLNLSSSFRDYSSVELIAAVDSSSSTMEVARKVKVESSSTRQGHAEKVTYPVSRSQPKLEPLTVSQPKPLLASGDKAKPKSKPQELPSNASVPIYLSSSPASPLTDLRKQEPDDWSWPYVHIVQSRFMQDQASLINLARARLELFRIFCLPTMKAQTTQQFLWFIRIDPNLDKSMLKEMIDLLKDHPNFYLIGSNKQGRPFDEIDVDTDTFYTGNRTLYLTAKGVQEQKSLPLFETRLDADDGLHVDYLRNIQIRATQSFAREKLSWLVFCTQTAMEWRMYPKGTYGSLSNKKERKCMSPGLTVAFPAGAFSRVNPGYREHNKVAATINTMEKRESCGYNLRRKCLVILNAESSNGSFPAIRARTPTSTGMENIIEVSNRGMSEEAKNTMDRLPVLQIDYNISRGGLQWLNKYMEEHVVDISTENLKGQCTPGHSCKVR